MFADALDRARVFTQPLIQSVRHFDHETRAGAAACVVLNRDGWIVTAAHVLDAFMAAQQHALEIQAYQSASAAILADRKLNRDQRHKLQRKNRENPKWITNQSMVAFVAGGFRTLVDWTAARDIDLAVARIEPFDASWVTTYPVFRKLGPLRPGTSLCRLGYPFVELACTYDDALDSFNVTGSGLPFFPNEGIFTREVIGPQSPNGPFSVRFVETSSPGLMGQSGGPLLDVHGTVWGIQSHVQHLDLGYPAKLKRSDGTVVEVYQFLNVGRAVHPMTIHEFLTHTNVPFNIEP